MLLTSCGNSEVFKIGQAGDIVVISNGGQKEFVKASSETDNLPILLTEQEAELPIPKWKAHFLNTLETFTELLNKDALCSCYTSNFDASIACLQAAEYGKVFDNELIPSININVGIFTNGKFTEQSHSVEKITEMVDMWEKVYIEPFDDVTCREKRSKIAKKWNVE